MQVHSDYTRGFLFGFHPNFAKISKSYHKLPHFTSVRAAFSGPSPHLSGTLGDRQCEVPQITCKAQSWLMQRSRLHPRELRAAEQRTHCQESSLSHRVALNLKESREQLIKGECGVNKDSIFCSCNTCV